MRKLPIFLMSIAVSVATTAIAQMPPTLVETQQLKTMEFHDQVTLVGRAEAMITSRIVSEVTGRITAVNALEGNRIEAGKTLVTVDSRRIGLTLAAREAEAIQAQARSELARADHHRVEQLSQRNLTSESAVDSSRALTIITESEFKRLDAERGKLSLDLANCKIKAPFSGYTGRQLINVGDWVNPGTPVFEMADLSRIKVVVDLPERYFGQVAIGSSVQMIGSKKNARSFPGVVSGVAPIAALQTHTFPVIITVDNKDGRLAAGMLLRATLSLNKKFSSLAVSKDAIIRQGSMTMIYTIRDGLAASLNVITSSSLGEMVAVSGEGLEEDMPVVVRGNERIFPGSPVRTAGGSSGPPHGKQGEKP